MLGFLGPQRQPPPHLCRCLRGVKCAMSPAEAFPLPKRWPQTNLKHHCREPFLQEEPSSVLSLRYPVPFLLPREGSRAWGLAAVSLSSTGFYWLL